MSGEIFAYASATSVEAGGSIDFHVSAPVGKVTLRVVAKPADVPAPLGVSSPDTPAGPFEVTFDGSPHATPYDASERGCGWPSSYTLVIPKDWKSGLYEAQLSSPGAASSALGFDRVQFVVRSAKPGESSKILFCWPITTVLAYSQFHKPPDTFRRSAYLTDLYESEFPGRRYRVSLDKPLEGKFGEYDTHDAEVRFMQWLDDNAIATESCTSIDLHADPELLGAYNLLLSVGHDEYWSREMRDHVEAFVAAGGNAAFFSANTCWWQVRFEDGNRTMVCHKSALDDPLTGTDDARVTINWASSPLDRPENSLTGVSFRNGAGAWAHYNEEERLHTIELKRNAAYRVAQADNWVFADTGLNNGDSFGAGTSATVGILGYETDAAELSATGSPTGRDGTPLNLVAVAAADLEHWRESGRAGSATMGYYQNGGTVFTAGTFHWGYRLRPAPPDPVVEQITRNVLNRLRTRTSPLAPRATFATIKRPSTSWEEIGVGETLKPMVAMTGVVEGHLLAAADKRLWHRPPVGDDVAWDDVGPLPGSAEIAALASPIERPGRLLAATTKGHLYTRDPVPFPIWWYDGPNGAVVNGLAVPQESAFATTPDGRLLWMPLQEGWEDLMTAKWSWVGAAPNVSALCDGDGKLFGITSTGRLLCRESIEVDVRWEDIGDAPAKVAALAWYFGCLFAITAEGRLYWRSAVPTPAPMDPGKLLFYRSTDGRGVIGSFAQSGDFRQQESYPDGSGNSSFRRDWSHIVAGSRELVLFYDTATGTGASARVDRASAAIHTLKGSLRFSSGWTHVVRAGDCIFLFYNALNGAGAIGRLEPDGSFKTLRSLPDGAFSEGWSHIVATDDRALLFYDDTSGSGATGYVTDGAEIVTKAVAGPFLKGWSHIAPTGHSMIFFYNRLNGAAALGALSRGGSFTTLRSWPDKTFPPAWSHLVGGSNGLVFFYRSSDAGTAVGGFLRALRGGDASFIELRDYGPYLFSQGWTHIAAL